MSSSVVLDSIRRKDVECLGGFFEFLGGCFLFLLMAEFPRGVLWGKGVCKHVVYLSFIPYVPPI